MNAPERPPGETRKAATYCYQCVAGPDLLTVKVVNGVATEVEPNFAAAAVHPGGGKVCVKAYGLVQKLYNPNRISSPMKRTNPKKGRDEHPVFVPISWEEALDTIAGKLLEIRARGLTDESGYPRVAASFGGGGTPQSYMGTFPAFLSAWGPVDMGFGSGQGVKCTHSEHLYGEFWHRAFTVSPDTPLCEYVISCGANTEASGGVVGVWRHADARIRGMKRVQVEPHLSITGACSAEWVPIKPKTDAALLYALIHVLLHENPRERLDVAFLRDHTSSPYLVGPNGFYLRDPETRQPIIADKLEASVRVRAIETGADGEVLAQGELEGTTAFAKLLDAHEALQPRVGERHLRRARRDHAAHRQRISGSRAHRRDHRDRRQDAAVPPGRGGARQDGQQRLGRLRVLLGAHHARGAGRRARSPRRNARHHGAAQSPAFRAARERQAGSRRLHGLSAQSRPTRSTGARSRTSATPTAASFRSPPTVPGARRSGRRISPGCSSARRLRGCRASPTPSCGSSIAPTRRSPSGTRRNSPSAWRAFPSSSPWPTRSTRPITSPTSCCPTRWTWRACSSSASAARSTSSSSGSTRASPCASRWSSRMSMRRTSPTSLRNSRAAPGCWSATTTRSTAAPPA